MSNSTRTRSALCLSIFAIAAFYATVGQGQQPQPGREGALLQNPSAYQLLQQLSEQIGSRFVGTPAYNESVAWAERYFAEWDLKNIQRHPFSPDHQGWSAESFDARLLTPEQVDFSVHPLPYSIPTQGTISGPVIAVSSLHEFRALSESQTHQLDGAILLLAERYRRTPMVASFEMNRLSDQQLAEADRNEDPNNRLIGYHIRRPVLQAFSAREQHRKVFAELLALAHDTGIAALIQPSDYPMDILHVDEGGIIAPYPYPDDPALLPSFVMANQSFGYLLDRLEQGHTPTMSVSLKAQFYSNPQWNVSISADIPGSDPNLKEEIVLVGAHLDSWYAGTGAVDNGAGVTAAMAAMQKLASTGAKPRRTIRIILWGGHERGFLGSRQYIEDHVGSFVSGEIKPMANQISAYLNLDNGAGRIRGLYLMGNVQAKETLTPMLEEFVDDNTLTLQYANQSDHELLDYFNIPAFQFIQDPLNYIEVAHHTNLDTLEFAPSEDIDHNAAYVAHLAFQIANLDQLLPRRPYISPTAQLNGAVEIALKDFQDAENVSIVADFNQWNMFGTPLARTEDGWVTRLDLPPGRYLYKFIIDGSWTADPATPADQLLSDGKGHAGLTELIVK